jgi:hypothetical protein
MRKYQILTLIGSILGIVSTSLAIVIIFFPDIGRTLFGEYWTDTHQIEEPVEFVNAATILYIIAIISAFVIKQKTKVVGITLLVIAVATLIVGVGGFSVICFAFLLTGGIVALRYKMPSVQQD